MRKTFFKCSVCGKLTAGRMPNENGIKGDTSFRFPRRHNDTNGNPCAGNIEEAIWVDVPNRLTAVQECDATKDS